MPRRVDVDTVAAPSFGLVEVLAPGEGAVHVHRRHQLVFAASGALELRIDEGPVWFLPTQRMAWVPAGQVHSVRVPHEATLRTAYFDPDHVPAAPRCCVFGASPLLVQLMRHASTHYGVEAPSSRTRTALFDTLYGLACEASAQPLPLALRRPSSSGLQRALAWLEQHLADTTAASLAAQAGMSERTLARALRDELGLGYRDLVRHLRMRRAVERLSASPVRPSELAYELGYTTPSAFSAAFRATFAESPSAFRQRARG